jgi:hypothetical protein
MGVVSLHALTPEGSEKIAAESPQKIRIAQRLAGKLAALDGECFKSRHVFAQLLVLNDVIVINL